MNLTMTDTTSQYSEEEELQQKFSKYLEKDVVIDFDHFDWELWRKWEDKYGDDAIEFVLEYVDDTKCIINLEGDMIEDKDEEEKCNFCGSNVAGDKDDNYTTNDDGENIWRLTPVLVLNTVED